MKKKTTTTRKRTPHPAAMITVTGSDAMAVAAARDAVLSILVASKSTEVILAALNAFTKAATVNATISDCTFTMGAQR